MFAIGECERMPKRMKTQTESDVFGVRKREGKVMIETIETDGSER